MAMGDASQTREIAHSLKGAVAALGATTAYALAAELEAMGQTAQRLLSSTLSQSILCGRMCDGLELVFQRTL